MSNLNGFAAAVEDVGGIPLFGSATLVVISIIFPAVGIGIISVYLIKIQSEEKPGPESIHIEVSKE